MPDLVFAEGPLPDVVVIAVVTVGLCPDCAVSAAFDALMPLITGPSL
jgi:hypothetical protein